MKGKALIITRSIVRNNDLITGLFHVPQDSPWFVGHFPAHPILPAIALIELVARILGDGDEPEEGPLSIRQLSRVRFRQIVRPGEDIAVTITPDKKTGQGRYRFKISSPEKVDTAVADGLVLTAAPVMSPGFNSTNIEHRSLGDGAGPGQGRNLEKYLPHREPMKLVDAIVGGSGHCVKATVKENWPLFEPAKGVSPIVVVELVAQATAVMMGLEEEGTDEEKTNLGYIVGIKEARWGDQYFQIGSELTVKTKKQRWQDNYGLFTGEVYQGPSLCGEVHVQVFRPAEVL